MLACFIVPELAPSGGIRVVLDHARRLADEHGFEVDVVSLDDLDRARGRRYDVAIATWWTTAEALYALDTERRALFVQSLEYQWYRADEEADRLPAALPLSLPVSFLTVSRALAESLRRLRPEAPCHLIPNGIDKDVFAPRTEKRPEGGPLRVLVEGQPTIWLKGVEDALRAVRRMSEPAHVTVVALDGAGLDELDADEVRSGLDAREMAALYADSDVLLKLSRVEGLGLPALEAMHVGVPCVVTPFAGQADYLEHGRNGLVVEFDDEPGAARWLDVLARDRELLTRLGEGARETAAGWPDPSRSTELMAEALRAVADAPSPAPEPALADLVSRVRLAADVARNREGALRWTEAALAEARTLVEELSRSRDDCAQMLESERDKHATLNSSRMYRALRRARRMAGTQPLWP
jgi:glycosyltransferase involved in cell wall biosynthesis